MLSEKEQAIVEGGLQAEALLDNPTFVTIMQGLSLQCFEAFIASIPPDSLGRENTYNLFRGLQAIEEELRGRISAKDEITRRLDDALDDDQD